MLSQVLLHKPICINLVSFLHLIDIYSLQRALYRQRQDIPECMSIVRRQKEACIPKYAFGIPLEHYLMYGTLPQMDEGKWHVYKNFTRRSDPKRKVYFKHCILLRTSAPGRHTDDKDIVFNCHEHLSAAHITFKPNSKKLVLKEPWRIIKRIEKDWSNVLPRLYPVSKWDHE
jgi:hypothetical protein